MTAPIVSAHGGGSTPAGLLANTAYLFGSRGLEAILRGSYALILAGWLGPELYGLFSVGMSWYLAFLPLGIWGMTVILLRDHGRAANDADRLHLLGATLGLRLLTSLLATLLCFGLTLSTDDTAARAVSAGFALALTGRACAMWANDVLVARGNARRVLRLQGPLRVLEVVAGIAALAAHGGLWGVVVVHGLIWWLQAGLGLLAVRREAGAFQIEHRRAALLPLLRGGLSTTVLGFANSWLLFGVLVLAARGLVEPWEVGQLALAQQVYLLALTLLTSLATTSLPFLSRAAEDRQGDDRRLAGWVLKLALPYAAVAAIAGDALASWLLEVLFADRYLVAGTLVGPYLWLIAIDGLNMTQSQLLLARRRDGAAMLCSVAGALAMTAAMFPALELFGLTGAILAAAIGRLVRGLLLWGYHRACAEAGSIQAIPRAVLLLALVFCADVGLGQVAPFAAPFIALTLLGLGWLFWLLEPADRSGFAARLPRLLRRTGDG